MPGFASRLAFGRGVFAAASAAVNTADGAPGATDWPSTNYDQSANRYSPLTQITAENVSTLQQVWSVHLKPAGFAGPHAGRRGHSDRDRQHDVSRLAVWRRHRAGRHDRRGEVEIPASRRCAAVEARRRVLAGRRRSPAPAVDHLRDRRRAGCTRSRRRTARSTSGSARTASSTSRRPRSCRPGRMPAYSLLSSPTIYKNLIITGAGTGEGPGGSTCRSRTRGRYARLGRQDRQAGVDVPYRAAAGRVRL